MLQALKLSSEDEYMDFADHGARVLFNIDEYSVLDGTKDETDSYFLYNDETERWYLLDVKTCYDLVAAKLVGVEDEIIRESLDEIARNEPRYEPCELCLKNADYGICLCDECSEKYEYNEVLDAYLSKDGEIKRSLTD